MFINLKNNEITINTYRFPDAVIGELSDLLLSIENNTGETLVCILDGALAALEDGEYLGTVGALSIETVETLYNEIKEASDNENK